MLIVEGHELNHGPVKDKANDLEDRLVDFAVRIIGVVEALPDTKAGNHIAGQLVRSETSPAPNYGGAQSAESRNDFIHKMKVWLKITVRKPLYPPDRLAPIIQENDEPISIFVKSVKTAQTNKDSERRGVSRPAITSPPPPPNSECAC